MKVVEFVSFKSDKLHFIESKGSAPKETKIKKPNKVYEEPSPYSEENLNSYFEDWSSDDFEHWTKWKVKHDKMERFFQDLYDKMNHSLNLIVAKELEIKKHFTNEIPCGIKGLISGKRIVFLLIINSKNVVAKEHYSSVLEKLNRKFIPLKRIWDIEIKIFNDKQAEKQGFIACF